MIFSQGKGKTARQGTTSRGSDQNAARSNISAAMTSPRKGASNPPTSRDDFIALCARNNAPQGQNVARMQRLKNLAPNCVRTRTTQPESRGWQCGKNPRKLHIWSFEMHKKLAILSALPICLMPLAAFAQGPTVNIGVDLTSNYVDEGATASGNQAAIQPHIEFSSGIFYGGFWFSNIVSGADTFESDVYAGITGDLGGSSGVSYDISYTRVYFNATGDQGGTLESNLSYAPSDAWSVGVTVKNDLIGGPIGVEFGGDYALPNGFGLSGEIGRSLAAGSATYWNVAVSKDISDQTSFELGYHKTSASAALYTATLSWATDLNGIFEK